jgi:ubiquinone biosynthesis protein
VAMVLEGTAVRVPHAHRDLCTRRLIVQERFEGVTLTDVDRLDVDAVNREKLARELLHSMLHQVLRNGFFHADPHPGNIFVFTDGTLGLIDFGAVGRLDPIQQSAVIDMLGALVQRDVGLLRDAVEQVADIDAAVSPEKLQRALARLLAEHVRPSGGIDSGALQDLVQVLSEFGVRMPRDLVVLSRALVTLEGTLRVVAPQVSMVSEAAELVRSPEAPAFDPKQMARDELMAALPRLRRLPDRMDRILTMTARGDLRFRTVIDEDGQRILRTLANRALLAMIGAVFLVVGAALLVAPEPGPIVTNGTGLFEVLGYGGLLAAVVLLLRVAAAVARDGTT